VSPLPPAPAPQNLLALVNGTQEEIRLRRHWKSHEATKLYLQAMQSSLEALKGPEWFCPFMKAINQTDATLHVVLQLPSAVYRPLE
jgi:hypothetical protein